MIAGVLYDFYKAGWAFYALGPQLVVCLALGYLAARKSGGDLLHWLVVAFFVSLLPLAGVVLMVILWRRAACRPASASEGRQPDSVKPPA
jgi:hypothetical protein